MVEQHRCTFAICGNMEFDIHIKLFALGSDGASVMLGCLGLH